MIGKAVSSPKRLELLDLIRQGKKTVETLSRETGLSVANTSQHLQTLKTARFIKAEKEGLYVRYRLADEGVAEFFRSMCLLAVHRLAKVEMIKRRFLKGGYSWAAWP
ncbi:MAG: metalloregulator ArsR/SmtB family transcription factor [Desulfosarcinaceae bacterium]|nr:metalloregulator ArsR/SmtB family transcription factor [Desulfosarcinaceae bacterium]